MHHACTLASQPIPFAFSSRLSFSLYLLATISAPTPQPCYWQLLKEGTSEKIEPPLQGPMPPQRKHPTHPCLHIPEEDAGMNLQVVSRLHTLDCPAVRSAAHHTLCPCLQVLRGNLGMNIKAACVLHIHACLPALSPTLTPLSPCQQLLGGDIDISFWQGACNMPACLLTVPSAPANRF